MKPTPRQALQDGLYMQTQAHQESSVISKINPCGTDWSNIDLSSYESSLAIVDEYTFDGLLLEINCNLRTIDAESVMKQFNESLQSRIDSAREIMRDNLANIVKHAQEYRNQD
jgi:hypothetical protein